MANRKLRRPAKKRNKKNAGMPAEITEPIKSTAKKEMVLAKKNPELSINLAKLTNERQGGNRRTMFAILRIHGHTQEHAAKLCGYHPGSGSRLERQMKTDPKYQKEISEVLGAFPDAYRDFAKARLPDIAQVESNALAAMKEDPILAVKHPGLLRSMKAATGIQEIEEHPKDVVNLNLAQLIIKHALGVEDQTIDTDVIDIKQIGHDDEAEAE